MKRFGSGLLLPLFLLSVACSGLASITTLPPASGPGSTKPALKENQVQGFWDKWDPKTDEVILIVNRAERKYTLGKGVKFFDAGGRKLANTQGLFKTDAIFTVEKVDGKEVVTEIKGVPRPTGPSKTGTQVKGKFVKWDYEKKPEILVMEIDGKERTYTVMKYARWYGSNGESITSSTNDLFRNSQIIAVVESKDGKEEVVEVWGTTK